MTGARDASTGPVVRRRGPLALYAGFTLLIAAVASSIWFTVRQQDAFDRVNHTLRVESELAAVGSSRVDLQACKLEYSIVSPK